MISALKDLGQWRDETDAHLAKLDRVTEDQKVRSGADLSLLKAIRENQIDHTKSFAEVKDRLGNVETEVKAVSAKLTRLEGRLSSMDLRLSGVEVRLTGVETRLDGVETRLGGVEESLGTVKTDMSLMNGKLDQIIDRLK
jgi:chromosome segregation ATPase